MTMRHILCPGKFGVITSAIRPYGMASLQVNRLLISLTESAFPIAERNKRLEEKEMNNRGELSMSYKCGMMDDALALR